MNFDLFSEDCQVNPTAYRKAFENWLGRAGRGRRLQRESSSEVYEHMWSALTSWAVAHGLALQEITSADLDAYLASRGGDEDLTARYSLRLLRLVERVLADHSLHLGLAENHAAAELISSRPALRFANSAEADPVLEFLPATEAKLLVTYLSAVRPGRSTVSQAWQEVRNRSSVALMLGAGLTPGEVRVLKLHDVVVDGGHTKDVPWKLRVPGNGNAPGRETPVAPWAAQLLRFWMIVREEQGIPGLMLFPSTKSAGRPWGKVAQYNAARQVLRACGIDSVEGGSFRLRHTFALRQLRRGKPPEEVALWLGVSDPEVMARYRRVLVAPVDVV